MTIGKKISFLRKRLKITQEDLAERTGIHVVSIRRYENDKMLPKEAQVEKIANVLNVRPYVLSESNLNFNIETDGDLYSLFISLYKSGLITFKNANDGNNVDIEINDNITKLFDLIIHSDVNKNNDVNKHSDVNKKINKHTLSLSLNNNLKDLPSYNLFLRWLDAIKGLEGFINSLADKDNPVAVETIKTIKEQIEQYELELLQSAEKL